MLRWVKVEFAGDNACDYNVLARMLFLFQTLPVLTTDVPFNLRQKDISEFIRQGEKWVKYKVLYFLILCQ